MKWLAAQARRRQLLNWASSLYSQGMPANSRTGQREERFVDVGSFVVADAKTAKLISRANVRSTTQRHRPKPLPCLVRRIASSGRMWRVRKPCRMGPHHSRGRRAHRPAGSGVAASPCSERNRIDQGQGFLRVVPVGAGQADRKRDALSITDQMPFAPALGAIGGFGPVCVPPHTARTEQLSTMARDQSMSPSRASQFRSAKCNRSQMPSACQSRRRRQQVMPDPQPSSCGNICHGMPLRSTKRMPVRHARSGTRGRPPFGRGGGTGSSGAIRFPQRVGQQHGGHNKPPTLSAPQVRRVYRAVLLCALRQRPGVLRPAARVPSDPRRRPAPCPDSSCRERSHSRAERCTP